MPVKAKAKAKAKPKAKAAPKKKTPAKAPKTKAPAKRKPAKPALATDAIKTAVIAALEDDKAEDMVIIPLAGKSSLADYMVIASGRSTRQVATMAMHVREAVQKLGYKSRQPEGMRDANWVVVDAGDIIVHLFRPEVRQFYNLEKMWREFDSEV